MSVHNVSNEDVAFWSHEWVKHGTCAAQLPELDSEHAYFSKALELAEKYDMKKLLEGAGIPTSSSLYDADTIWSGVKDALGVKPFLSCFNYHVSSILQVGF